MTGKAIYSEHILMDSLLQFMQRYAHRPFFIHFATQLPHGPVSIPQVHPDLAEDSRLTPIEKEYASMVKMLDDDVGRIMAALERLGLAENTLVIFTSDNGHEIYYAQEGRVYKPYRNARTKELFDNLERKYYSDSANDLFNGNDGRAGLKRSNLQGGIEVPLIARWPAQIQKGQTTNRLTAHYEFLATLAQLTGVNTPLQRDGKSFAGELMPGYPSQEAEFLVFSSFEGPALITRDGWKLRSYLPAGKWELYYLPDDYREAKNLAQQNPAKLNALKALLLKACDGDYHNGLYGGREIPVN